MNGDGTKAWYRGSGTINGGTEVHQFLIGVDDGRVTGITGDKFRIKIWKADGSVVYDNLAGGADDAALTATQALTSGTGVLITR